MFHKTNITNDTSGPSETRYYSAADGGVYYLYLYYEEATLRGHLDKPWGLDDLSGSVYGITGTILHSWKIQLQPDFRTEENYKLDIFNGALNPFADGAGWEGTWTLPVCDTRIHNWNTQYGNKSISRYGMLPCCCGVNCTDTAAFVKAANMYMFQTLQWGCRGQLKHSDLKFKDIHYGYDLAQEAYEYYTWPRAGQVLFILAFIILPPIGWYSTAYIKYQYGMN